MVSARADFQVAHRFFFQREVIEEKIKLGFEDDIPGLLEYQNLPRTIGAVISANKATLIECDTVYSVEDIYIMLEVVVIDAHNRRTAEEWARRNSER